MCGDGFPKAVHKYFRNFVPGGPDISSKLK